MKSKLYEYDGEKIKVTYNVARCIHVEECVKGLPGVFDRDRRPWVDPDAADADEVAAVIERCPTGALQCERKDGGAQESAPSRNTVTVDPDGPLYLQGDIEVASPDGEVLLKDTRVALCRCGASKNKPLCDNTHVETGFEHSGTLGKFGSASDIGPGTLRIVLVENGPMRLQGPAEIKGREESVTTERATLCRCGGSNNKPFCDGTHLDIGFQS